jgi:pyruvate-formate lyase-activating enzyme
VEDVQVGLMPFGILDYKGYTMSLPIFEDYCEGYGGSLECPNCQSYCTHQIAVDVFFRYDEDSLHGIHAFISSLKMMVDTDMKENPSRRRQGLRITFECEQCDVPFYMTIIQHKGTTYVDIGS